MAHATDAGELLDIEVQKIPGGRPLVAIRRTRRIQPPELIQAEPPLLAHNGRDRQPQIARDAHRAPASAPSALDLASPDAMQAARRLVRAGRPIVQGS
ncbi:MAG TPA: hypothetical protein VHE78_13505 [Gemmatimonadaceae bacterium]|nr:hypothetical protein [Gemmatimonadaceae bacterium]